MSRLADLQTIYYRKFEPNTDAHGVVSEDFSDTLLSVQCTLRPDNIIQEIKDVGMVATRDYLIYVPIDINPNFDVNIGDGFYLDTDDVNSEPTEGVEPTWVVVNTPRKLLNHYLLVLKQRVGE